MYKNILVPLALTPECNSGRALEIAHLLAGKDGKIHALNVVEAIPGYVSSYLPENFHDLRQTEALTSLKAEIGGDTGVNAMVTIGHPGRAIVDHAEAHGCDCIVIASHRPGIGDLFLGSTAAWVVRHAATSVHVLR